MSEILSPLLAPIIIADPLDRGLVADWRLDRDTGLLLPDYSGYSNSGAISGAVWTSANCGPALLFSTGDVVTIGGSTVYVQSGKPFSVEVLCRLDAFTDTWPAVFVLRTDTTYPFEMGFSDNGGYLDVFFGSRDTFSRLRCDLAETVLGTLFHFIITYNGQGDGTDANYALYANCTKRSLTSGGTLGAKSQASRLSSTTNGERFVGIQALLRVYNRKLADAEATKRYEIVTARASGLHVSRYWDLLWGIGEAAPPPPGIVIFRRRRM